MARPSWLAELPRAILVSAIVSAVVSAGVFTAGETWQSVRAHILPLPKIVYVPGEAQEDVSALRIERCKTEACFEEQLRRHRHSAPVLARDWNSHKGRVVIGSPDQPSQWFYLPEPLKGFEAHYESLRHRGLAGLLLHEVHVPRFWTHEQLHDKLYKWATECKVQRDWILRWSSFRRMPPRYHAFGFDLGAKELEIECHTGGTCLVVAKNCPQGTFSPLTRSG